MEEAFFFKPLLSSSSARPCALSKELRGLFFFGNGEDEEEDEEALCVYERGVFGFFLFRYKL